MLSATGAFSKHVGDYDYLTIHSHRYGSGHGSGAGPSSVVLVPGDTFTWFTSSGNGRDFNVPECRKYRLRGLDFLPRWVGSSVHPAVLRGVKTD